MKEGVAFEVAGMAFAPKPAGWDQFAVMRVADTLLNVCARDWLGRDKSVLVDLTHREAELLDEGILRLTANKLRNALAEFKPLDALDILRVAQ